MSSRPSGWGSLPILLDRESRAVRRGGEGLGLGVRRGAQIRPPDCGLICRLEAAEEVSAARRRQP